MKNGLSAVEVKGRLPIARDGSRDSIGIDEEVVRQNSDCTIPGNSEFPDVVVRESLNKGPCRSGLRRRGNLRLSYRSQRPGMKGKVSRHKVIL